MLRELISKAWKRIPLAFRRGIIRSSQDTFTVSAAAIVMNNRSEILVLKHLLRPRSGWGLPGGFIERGEQPSEGIRREIREEVGIELEDVRLLRVRTIDSHIEMLFFSRTDASASIKSGEITDLGWFTADALPDGVGRAHREMIERVLRGEI
jgi:ADP-ribose pyrophosphatase YjhB (NUDIX family)